MLSTYHKQWITAEDFGVILTYQSRGRYYYSAKKIIVRQRQVITMLRYPLIIYSYFGLVIKNRSLVTPVFLLTKVIHLSRLLIAIPCHFMLPDLPLR